MTDYRDKVMRLPRVNDERRKFTGSRGCVSRMLSRREKKKGEESRTALLQDGKWLTQEELQEKNEKERRLRC